VDDLVAYVLILGLFVIPGYSIIQLAERIMYAVYWLQSSIISFPFP
jgi:hypothetical protein